MVTAISARARKPAAQRREQILATAQELFAAQGYDKVVMDDIARACGLARTTLYEYYRSKDEILQGLIEHVLEENPPMPPPDGTCRERLTHFAAGELARLVEHRFEYQLLFNNLPALGGPVTERIAARQRTVMSAVFAVLGAGAAAGEVRPDVTPADAAFLFLALVSQAGNVVIMTAQEVDPQTEAHRLMRLMWHGVGTT